MEFASTVWDPHHIQQVKTLEMVQHRTARCILQDFSRTSSASEMVEKLKLETLKERRTADKASMMYKVMHDLVDVAVPPELLQPAARSTRGHHLKLQVLQTSTDSYKYSFFPSGIRLWNSLDTVSVVATSLPDFKLSLKAWIARPH